MPLGPTAMLELLVLLAAVPALVLGAPPTAGDNLGLWTCTPSNPRQVFALQTYPSTSPQTIFSQTLGSSLVWDISGPSKNTGTPVHLWGPYHPVVPNQQWVLSGNGEIVSNYAPDKCLRAATGANLGEPLGIYPCNASDPLQGFTFTPSTGLFSLTSSPSLCIQGGNTSTSCDVPPFNTYPYCNPTLPLDTRVADLVGRMTPAELAAAMDSSVPAISRLGVPSMHSGEALHGAATGCLSAPAPNSTGCPTSFPSPIALGATFDKGLWGKVGAAIGTEARALSNLGVGAVWVFAPNVNPARDPRWGRNQEVPSEDALLVSNYASSFIAGLQGDGSGQPHLLVASTAKHYIGYDMEGYIPRTDPQPRPASSTCDTPGGCQRWNFDASPPARDINAYYLPPFTAAVSVGVRSIMCAYSGWEGAPACGSPSLNTLLRESGGPGGWDGHVVSDCTAIELMGDAKWDSCKPPFPPSPANPCTPDTFPGHDFTHTVGETALAALVGGGVDNNCGPFFKVWLEGLVANGTLPLSLLRTSVSRIYRSAILLGLLDPIDAQPYAKLGAESVDNAVHRALALQAAQESLVLLKNSPPAPNSPSSASASSTPLLPLAPGKRLAFLGPHANSSQAFLSNYHGDNTLVNANTPLLAAAAAGLTVTYSRGCAICDTLPPGFPNMPCTRSGDESGIPAAVAAAAAADVAVVFVGLDQTSEAENFDRGNLTLPGAQEALVLAVLEAQPNTVVVLVSGGVVSSPPIVHAAPAILQAFYGGELAGPAIVSALVGSFNPSGKLPLTMYYNNFTARDIRDMDLSSSGGVTHTYFSGPVLFPFAYGLSFSSYTFNAAWEEGEGIVEGRGATHRRSDTTTPPPAIIATVTNTGGMAGDTHIMVFLKSPPAEGFSAATTAVTASTNTSTTTATPAAPAAVSPKQVFVHFERVAGLAPGETRKVRVQVPYTSAWRLAMDTLGVGAGSLRVEVGDVVNPAVLELLVQ